MARKAKAPKKKPSKKSKSGPAMSAAGIPVKAENWKAMALSGKSPTIEVNFEDGSAFEMRDFAAVMALTMLQTGPCYNKMTNPNGLCIYSGSYRTSAKSTA